MVFQKVAVVAPPSKKVVSSGGARESAAVLSHLDFILPRGRSEWPLPYKMKLQKNSPVRWRAMGWERRGLDEMSWLMEETWAVWFASPLRTLVRRLSWSHLNPKKRVTYEYLFPYIIFEFEYCESREFILWELYPHSERTRLELDHLVYYKSLNLMDLTDTNSSCNGTNIFFGGKNTY